MKILRHEHVWTVIYSLWNDYNTRCAKEAGGLWCVCAGTISLRVTSLNFLWLPGSTTNNPSLLSTVQNTQIKVSRAAVWFNLMFIHSMTLPSKNMEKCRFSCELNVIDGGWWWGWRCSHLTLQEIKNVFTKMPYCSFNPAFMKSLKEAELGLHSHTAIIVP